MKNAKTTASKTEETKAPRATIEDATSGPVRVEAKCKEPKELRLESKRGRLLSMLRTDRGVKQETAKKEFGWKDRDFADALRLLAKTNGVNSERNDKGTWHIVGKVPAIHNQEHASAAN